ncbi:MAG: hypothetical protein M1825_005621 [Sarcosagium campestre]|nr:MAG: hypothetical protein M1825_005621 [Sarcosagium campestre]
MESVLRSHRPTQPSSLRCPSPPRLLVPPTIFADYGELDVAVKSFAPASYESKDFVPLEFLKQVTFGDLFASQAMIDWRYEWRRKAQKILPFLYLGPVSAAKDADFLKSEGFTLLLAIRDLKSAQIRLLDGSRMANALGIQSDAIDVADAAELIASFPRVVNVINQHLHDMYQLQNSTVGKVLVYCQSGNERSATAVAAYLMAMYGMNVVQTIQVVQSQRFCAVFDDNMKNLLLSYEGILAAKRQVMESSREQALPNPSEHPQSRSAQRHGKRGLEEAYAADVIMGDVDCHVDEGRFEARQGLAPFQDV